jgi:uncharacterized protein (UPF0333 family)
MRGQAAFEYLIMFSIVLTILAILTYYAQDMTEKNSGDIISSNAVIAVNKIAEAADIVYTQGAPSQITVSVYIPENVNSITFIKNMIDMKIQVGSGISDIFATSKANFTTTDSFISPDYGTKRIKVKCCEGNNVSVTES